MSTPFRSGLHRGKTGCSRKGYPFQRYPLPRCPYENLDDVECVPIKCHSPQPRKLIGKGDLIGSRGQTLQGLYIWCPKHLSQCCDTWPSSRVQHHLWSFSVLVQAKHFESEILVRKSVYVWLTRCKFMDDDLLNICILQIYVWNLTWWFPLVLFQRTHFQVLC